MISPLFKKSIVVRVQGGLGNQMFQYAAGRALAKRLNLDLVLDLDWFIGREEDFLQYSLDNFNVCCLTRKKFTFVPRIIRRILFLVLDKFEGSLGLREVFKERYFNFNQSFLKIKSPVILQGYWQSEKYFNDIRTLLIKEFKLKQDLPPSSRTMLEKIEQCDSICVHIRRGDYLSNKNAFAIHGICPNYYYIQAVRSISKTLSNPKCFVFSDEPQWVRDNIDLGITSTIVDVNKVDQPCFDMILMSTCKHFVISNSTFSWWAAWLSTYPRKRIVAPLKWFVSNERNTSDLIPLEWERI